VDELDLAVLGGRGEEPAADVADRRLEPGDDARLEPLRQRLAVVGVPRRVHRQQHPAHHLERLGVEVLDDDAALARREQVRFTRDVDDVGVLEHRPEAGLAVHLLPVDGVVAPQRGQDVVRNAGDERVGAGQVDGRLHGVVSR